VGATDRPWQLGLILALRTCRGGSDGTTIRRIGVRSAASFIRVKRGLVKFYEGDSEETRDLDGASLPGYVPLAGARFYRFNRTA
jgi:hypothetical protein